MYCFLIWLKYVLAQLDADNNHLVNIMKLIMTSISIHQQVLKQDNRHYDSYYAYFIIEYNNDLRNIDKIQGFVYVWCIPLWNL